MEKGVDYNISAKRMLICTYILAAIGGIVGIFFGSVVYFSKVKLEDGTKVYKYKTQHRTIGLCGAILALISAVVWYYIEK